MALLGITAALWLLPIIYMIDVSFRLPWEVFDASIISPSFTLGNYQQVFADNPLPVYFVNSIVVSVTTTALVVAGATAFAFAVSVLHVKRSRVVYSVVLLTLMVPIAALVVPVTQELKQLGLTNNPVGLILPYTALGIPFATVILVGVMDDLPEEVHEAAVIDGAGAVRLLLDVVVPMVRPSIVFVAIWQFITSWNEFFLALTVMTQDQAKTLPLIPQQYSGVYLSNPAALFADPGAGRDAAHLPVPVGTAMVRGGPAGGSRQGMTGRSVRAIGVDVGTSSLKAVRIRVDGRRLTVEAVASRGYGQGGRPTRDPAVWVKAARAALAELADGGPLDAVGYAGQMHALVPVIDGVARAPATLWLDYDGEPQLTAFCRAHPDLSLLDRTGNIPLPDFTLAKWLRWRDLHPQLAPRVERLPAAKDHVRDTFTSSAGWITDINEASGTQLFDPFGQAWDQGSFRRRGSHPMPCRASSTRRPWWVRRSVARCDRAYRWSQGLAIRRQRCGRWARMWPGVRR